MIGMIIHHGGISPGPITAIKRKKSGFDIVKWSIITQLIISVCFHD